MERITLPFGKHKGQPLADVPADYLTWFLATVNPARSLRTALEAEAVRRGITTPQRPIAPPVSTGPSCTRCPDASIWHRWLQDRLGRRRVRRTCSGCGGFLGFAPSAPPFSTEADQAASAAPILDAMLLAEQLGIALVSDGQAVEFASPEDRRRAPEELRDLLRQCRHSLGSMIGKTKVQP